MFGGKGNTFALTVQRFAESVKRRHPMLSSTMIKQASVRPGATSTPDALHPISFGLSVLSTFAIAAITFASIHLFMPWLASQGYSPLDSMLAAHLVPMALLFTAALVAYHKVERNPLTWNAFSARCRYPRLRFRDVLWGLGLFAIASLGYGIVSQIGNLLIAQGILPVPQSIPGLMDPRVAKTLALYDQMAGGTIRGNWGVAALYFVMLFFNIAGEEFWWRGYLLPRQELTHGRWAWLVQGLLWTLFHVFKWWDVIGLLPVCLIITFSAQRMKNNWPAFIAHYLVNGMGFVLVLAAVLGVL
jgi:membrane protease YdiL (CAAX protease family)